MIAPRPCNLSDRGIVICEFGGKQAGLGGEVK